MVPRSIGRKPRGEALSRVYGNGEKDDSRGTAGARRVDGDLGGNEVPRRTGLCKRSVVGALGRDFLLVARIFQAWTTPRRRRFMTWSGPPPSLESMRDRAPTRPAEIICFSVDHVLRARRRGDPRDHALYGMHNR
jgi:hypothetical protein